MNQTAYFIGLAEKNINHVIVRDPNMRTSLTKCINLCKAVGYQRTFDLQDFNADLVSNCMRDCQTSANNYPTFDCPHPECCKLFAGDDDVAYVKCLTDNGFAYDMGKDAHEAIAPPTTTTASVTGSHFTVLPGTTFLPGATSYSCADTVNGYCIKNIGVDECIKRCDESPFCDFGYHIRLQPDGESYCLPLNNVPFYGEFLHKNVLQDTVPVSKLSVGSSLDATVFYRTHLDYSRPNTYSLTKIMPIVISQKNGASLDTHFRFSTDDPMQINIIPSASSLRVIQNHANVTLVVHNTNQCVVYNIIEERFMTLPLDNERIIALLSYDRTMYISEFQIQHENTRGAFILQKDDVTFRVSNPRNPRMTWISIEDERTVLTAEPHVFHIDVQERPSIEELDMDKVDAYYRDFWKRQPSSSSSDPSARGIIILWIVIVVVVVATLLGGLLLGWSRRR